MRRLTLRTLASALVALAVAAPPAPAQVGAAATCSTTVAVPRDRTFDDLLITKGNYTVIVVDTRELNCGEAVRSFRAFVAAPGSAAPAGWDVDWQRISSSADGTACAGLAVTWRALTIKPAPVLRNE